MERCNNKDLEDYLYFGSKFFFLGIGYKIQIFVFSFFLPITLLLHIETWHKTY